MKKIIHLSDLHIGHDDCYDKFLTIINKIKVDIHPARQYIVLITGDIVDNANLEEQTDQALESIKLLEEAGYMVLVIPGNHDYGSGVKGDARFVNIFKKRYFKSAKVSYPKLNVIDGIAFIGLDSTAEELHFLDRFLSEGELGKKQLNRLKKIINSPEINSLKKVVYLHHHPFDFKPGMQLKDSEHLKEIIEKRIDMLLFGHYHVDPDSAGKNYHGMWGIPRCYNAGSSTHKNDNAGHQRVIDLSKEDPGSDYDGKFI